ncbi:MAG: D-alanyl-D-alanine carboxypeptidase family protein [Patescibacteria group bacterium]|nr:D-alanyl-D-alanine carboxypeptidase family protein [Patescibacteria group bacterium]MBU1062939.1 D-alanyl-D-alanine carboxypeptidase family protein [Patescibacteria group bacterium]MBU1783190.1 D-alanyl-D-alanine carboxypeptidase family protein [Patescibacteria group bacterium]
MNLKKIKIILFIPIAIFFIANLFYFPISAKAEDNGMLNLTIPELQVEIPGLSLSGNSSIKCKIGEDCGIPWIGEYISGIYKYAIGIVGILAAVILMVAGVIWLTAGGNASQITEAKAWITASLTGLIIALCSYTILYQVNPELLAFKPLEIKTVQKEELLLEEEQESVQGFTPALISTFNGIQISNALINSLKTVEKELAKQNIQLLVTSGYRDIEKQKELIKKNCGGYPPKTKCSPPTCLLKNGAKSCPHTTGRAVDIWVLKNKKQIISMKECQKDISNCRQKQKELINAMLAQGFCVLSTEPWHFENPQMSTNCLQWPVQ